MKKTGGAIRLDKSFAYALFFKFNTKEEYRFESVQELYWELLVKNEFNKWERLRLIEPYKGIDILGMLLALDGSMSDKINYLIQKTTKWAQAISENKLSLEDT